MSIDSWKVVVSACNLHQALNEYTQRNYSTHSFSLSWISNIFYVTQGQAALNSLTAEELGWRIDSVP